jgi:hypothetical protein
MSNIKSLQEQKELLELQLRDMTQKKLEAEIIEEVKKNLHIRDGEITLEEFLLEYKEGERTVEYKGITFKISLLFDNDYDGNIYRTLKIIDIKDWKVFEKIIRSYRKITQNYRKISNKNYSPTITDFPQKFGSYVNYGSIARQQVLTYWKPTWTTCSTNIDNTIKNFKEQIDFIEDIANEKTDLRDDELSTYTDEQLLYELKVRKTLNKTTSSVPA